MLKQIRKPKLTICPVGLKEDKTIDLWLQIDFFFNPKTTQVEVESWVVTNYLDQEVSLSVLKYAELPMLGQAMLEELSYAQKFNYEALADEHYNVESAPSVKDDEFGRE